MIIIKKHISISYIVSRLKQILYFKKYPDNPWMTKDSVNLLEQLIKKTDVGLEYGSGKSTKWFAMRCKHLTSIEHNKEWFEIVSRKIKNQNNVDYRLLSLNDNPVESDYYKSIYEFSDKSLDFIINDGKFRDLIASEGIKKIKCGGIYILDNAERYLQNNLNLPESMISGWDTSLNWKYFNEITDKWRKIWTSDGVSSTLILIKTE